MDCDKSTCISFCILSAAAVFGVYLLFYVILYIYICYISDKDYSIDLHRWKTIKLSQVGRNLPPLTIIR